MAGEQIGLSQREARRFSTRASVIPNTNILRINVEGGHGKHAALMANALARAMEAEARKTFRVFTTEILDEAVTPHRPFAPTPKRSYTVAGVLGLLLGVAAVYAVTRPRKLTPPSST
jgi:capsular polysaccharide biosynthesis protein